MARHWIVLEQLLNKFIIPNTLIIYDYNALYFQHKTYLLLKLQLAPQITI